MNLQGPPEKSPEAKQLAINNSFFYWNLLGELIYAYVICRLDIRYAVCFSAALAAAAAMQTMVLAINRGRRLLLHHKRRLVTCWAHNLLIPNFQRAFQSKEKGLGMILYLEFTTTMLYKLLC